VAVSVISAVSVAGEPSPERLNTLDAKLLVAEPFAVRVYPFADVEHSRVIRPGRRVDADDSVEHLAFAIGDSPSRFRTISNELNARPPGLNYGDPVFIPFLERRPHERAD